MNLQEAIDAPAFHTEHAPSSFYPRAGAPGPSRARGPLPGGDRRRAAPPRPPGRDRRRLVSSAAVTAAARDGELLKAAPTRAGCRATRSAAEARAGVAARVRRRWPRWFRRRSRPCWATRRPDSPTSAASSSIRPPERCLWCSEEVARIHGLPVADCAALLTSAERARALGPRRRSRALSAAARRGRQQRGAYTIEYRLRNAEGELRWLYETGEHVLDPDSGAERLIGSIRDMTAQRDAEAALQRANEMLERRIARADRRAAGGQGGRRGRRTRGESQPRALSRRRRQPDGRARDLRPRRPPRLPQQPLSRSRARPPFAPHLRLGARFEEMVRAASEGGGMYHPDMGEDFVARRLGHHSAQTEDQEFRIADGRWVRVRESALPSGGRVLLTSDITARKTAQVELEEREQLLRRIADAIPLPIVITRINQPEVLFANELAIETFGLRIGPQPDAIRDAYVDPGDRRRLVEQLQRDGRVDNLEVRLRCSDGSVMWALLSARAITIHGQLAMLTTVTDISERKAGQVELEEREQRFRAIAEGVPLSIAIARIEPPRDPVRQRPRRGGLRSAGRARGRRGARGLRPPGRARAAGRAPGERGPDRQSRGRAAPGRRPPDVGAGLGAEGHLRRPAGDADRGHRHQRAQADRGGAAGERSSPRGFHGQRPGRDVPEGPRRPLRARQPGDGQGLRPPGRGDARPRPRPRCWPPARCPQVAELRPRGARDRPRPRGRGVRRRARCL